MKTLLIVESPAKAKTIEKLLGPGYIVKSSFGHIRDLDKKNLGIDLDNGFKPTYKIMSTRTKQIKEIQDTITKVDRVLLAADDDREGEAIAWHCAVVFKLKIDDMNRICFHEITKKALETAVASPRKINMSLVNSQQARRILDRIVGFQLSPLLWKYIAPKLSAGRVQSVCLKLIVEKECEIDKFSDRKYYKIIGAFNNKVSGTLNKQFEEEQPALQLLEHCKTAQFKIKNIEKKNSERRPPPPYITSSIQQDMGNRFGISSKKIMSVLQSLYEGGFITYHRTDNTNLSAEIQDEIKKLVFTRFGKNYVHGRIYKSKVKCAQEAHEAIRPTKVSLENLPDGHEGLDKKIYNLIWRRTIASQMSNCISEIYTMNISISERSELFVARAEKIIFEGYKKIYDDAPETSGGNDDGAEDADKDDMLSVNSADSEEKFIFDSLKEGEILKYKKIVCNEKYENPTPRYNESALIKKMEKIGIGRPSTYSNIIETIIERNYIEKKDVPGKKVNISIFTLEKNEIKTKKEPTTIHSEKKKLVPTDLGKKTNEFLSSNFENILDEQFTSYMEGKLDEIANSNVQWNAVIGDFYSSFSLNIVRLNSAETKTKYFQDENDKRRVVGKNEAGLPIYTFVGKYGPVIQIGDGKESMYVKLDEKYSVKKVTLQEVLELIKFPKNLGAYNGENVMVKNGRYGYYLQHNKQNYKISNGLNENLSLEDAIKCINGESTNNTNNKNEDEERAECEEGEENNKPKSGLIKDLGEYIVRHGPYGPYIIFSKKFYKIPANTNLEEIDKETCKKIITDSKSAPKKTYTKK